MNNLDLSLSYFGNAGTAALLDCLFNIQELKLVDCDLSPEMQAKITERAREMSVTVKFSY